MTNLINRPESIEDSKPMRMTHEMASAHWIYFMKTLLQTSNVPIESLQEAKRFVLLKQPTHDYMAKLDLIDVDPTLFRKNRKVALNENELEQLRILVTRG